MSIVSLKMAEVNGKKFTYSNETVFTVETGRGSKGSYSLRYHFCGDLRAALFYYNSINVGNGYKKRLCMNGKSLHRVAS